jgi:predicted RNA binding protein YcfA (HicA-like mRNA interferase family)
VSARARTVGVVAKKYREVRRRLRQEGWVMVRQSGSHESWRSRDGRLVTVAGKDSDTVPAGTLSAMRRATGLDDLR